MIGAGAAGLYVADILRSQGIKVVVYEASGEMGGRIKSLRNQTNQPTDSIADFPVELGAEFTFGSDSIWGKIIQNLNVPTVEVLPASHQYILDQIVKSGDGWAGDSDYQAVQNFIRSLPSYTGSAQSVEQASGVSERAKALLNSQAGNFYGSNSKQVGAEGLAQAMNLIKRDAKWLIMKANPLQDLLLSRFSLVTPMVQLNTPITGIDYSADPIKLTAKDGTAFEADKVIVTVPISILKSGGISFNPGLPGPMTSSLANLGMDPSIRVVLDFKKNFWGTDTGCIWGGTSGPQYFNGGVGRSEFWRTLSITINGPKAVELSAQGADMVNTLLAELDAVYAGQGTLYVRRDLVSNQILSIIQDWSKEEYIKGAFSYPLLNATADDRKNIGVPVNDKLFFAGEATDVNGDTGTINGALGSAERVAQEIIKVITTK